MLPYVALELGLLSVAIALKDYDTLRSAGMVGGGTVATVALIALGSAKPWEWGDSPRWVALLLVANVVMFFSAVTLPSPDTGRTNASVSDSGGKDPQVGGTATKAKGVGAELSLPSGMSRGKSVNAGLDPVAIAHVGDRILAMNSANVVPFDSDLSRGNQFPMNLPGGRKRDDPFDVAAHGSTVAAVNGGWLNVYNGADGERNGNALPFSQSEGHVAMTDGIAWLCDYDTSKVDRVELTDGDARPLDPKPVDVPGRPTGILVAQGLVYASVKAAHTGRISIIDPALDQLYETRGVDVEKGPAALVFAFDREIWVFHPKTSHITRIDATPGHEHVVAQGIEVDDDVPAMAYLGGSVFTISHDRVQRLDRNGRVIGELELPFRLVDLLAADGRLYVVSGNDNSITSIDVLSARKLGELTHAPW